MYCFSIDKDIYLLEKNGKKYLFVHSNGASIVACRIEEMVKWGSKKIYRIGTCGSLQKNINVGDIVLSFAAIKDEGTSKQYLSTEFPSVINYPNLFVELEKKLRNNGLYIHTGLTWTTDGRFVESNQKILFFSEQNVKSVDMETSAFLTVCWYKKVPGLSLSVVTDKPIMDIDKEFKGEIQNLSEIKEITCKHLVDIINTIINIEII